MGFRVSGKLAPDTVKPVPVTVAALTVTAVVPVEVRVTVCVAGEFRVTLPKAMVVALTLRVGVNAPNCREKVFVELPVLAVSVAVCAVLTAVAVAVKPALVAPAATLTLAGTVTALLLLDKFTLMPPVGAAPLMVTEHASVVAPVKELLVQLTDDTDGRIAIVPVPLNPTVSELPLVALLANVRLPDAAPVEVGSNCTVTEAV